ncbi:helix-turn-helix transcriptional regulator [Xenorhabdus sp. PB62.4]|uniref:ArsR/SmtB family transcription factor n=1 Tax=Xenorhabdus sp. PB62.4 TaxID=1851573 RepID=UPI001656C5DA|nr:winged helix-turn-helix domain-containing protein [Xenorhabdus sp. PB62.4]MBC8951810.1 nodulation protein NOLR [Xenorhabdus sp. PB62.4]
MKHEEVAASLAELGNSHRLAIFRFLVKAGHQGASVGEIQKALGIPASTLSHHLARMVKVGLIRQEKHSRTIVCIPEYQHLENLINFLQEECCMGISVEHFTEQSCGLCKKQK